MVRRGEAQARGSKTDPECNAKDAKSSVSRQRVRTAGTRMMSVQCSGNGANRADHQSVLVVVDRDSGRRAWLPVARKGASNKAVPALVPEAEDRDSVRRGRAAVVSNGPMASVRGAVVQLAHLAFKDALAAVVVALDSVRQPWRPVAAKAATGRALGFVVPPVALGNRVLASANDKAAVRDLARLNLAVTASNRDHPKANFARSVVVLVTLAVRKAASNAVALALVLKTSARPTARLLSGMIVDDRLQTEQRKTTTKRNNT